MEAPTYIVPDDVNRGGAQRRGRTDTTAFYYSSDLDYVLGRHSFRSGIELQHTRVRFGFRDQLSGHVLLRKPRRL